MFLLCVRDGWRLGQTAILTQLHLLTLASCIIFKNALSTSYASWLGLLNRESLRETALSGAFLVCKLALTLAFLWLNGRRHLPILFHYAHLLPLLLPLIYTSASLIDSLVKGQYITEGEGAINQMVQETCWPGKIWLAFWGRALSHRRKLSE